MKVPCNFFTFDQTFNRYQHNPRDSTSLSHNEVRTLYDDRQGTLWIGTGFPFFDDWKKMETSTGCTGRAALFISR